MFQYSLNSSTIKTTPLLQKISVASKAGYAGLEIWHDDVDEFVQSGGTVNDVRKCLDDHSIVAPGTIHLKDWFQPTGEIHATALDEARRKLEQAAILGASYVVAGPPRDTADRELGKRHYHELLEIGTQFGIRPAFEYLGFVQDLKTIDDALEIATGAAHPGAWIVLDPFHSHVGEGGFESIAKLNADQIAVSHFNDAPAQPEASVQRDPDRVMPGDGVIDLAGYCRRLREVEFNGFLSLELFRPDLWAQDPLSVAQLGLEKMKAAAES